MPGLRLAKHSLFRALLVWLMLALPAYAGAANEHKQQILCVLDFNRLGDDTRMDWLRRGLSDQMITLMSRVSPYQIIEREHLREILKEHGLARTGLIDTGAAIEQARLVKAQLLLLGNFAIQEEKLTIQVRLVRISDQEALSMATWEGAPSEVLSAPKALCVRLLDGVGRSFDPAFLEGIEKEIPQTINVAESFYRGMEAFDNGEYYVSLGHYLDSARHTDTFVRLFREVIKIHYLLNQNEHAVVFAQNAARALEKTDMSHALELYFAAAEKSIDSLQNHALAIELLEKIISLAELHEEQTREAAQTKAFVKERAPELFNKGREYYSNSGFRYMIVMSFESVDEQFEDIHNEIKRKKRYITYRNGKWIYEPIPEPSVFMWKTRAQLTLARLCARQENIHRALQLYSEIIPDYEFYHKLPFFSYSDYSHMRDFLKNEALFAVIYHYKKTGQIVPHPLLDGMIHEGADKVIFRRQFDSLDADPRARHSSRSPTGGFEDYYFAAPDGYQFDSTVLQAKIRGSAEFACNLPVAQGWWPVCTLSEPYKKFRFTKGTHKKTITFPEGTGIFSISSSWGYQKYDSVWEKTTSKMLSPDDRIEIAWWQASFVLSPRKQMPVGDSGEGEPDHTAEDDYIIRNFAMIDRWEEASVLRDSDMRFYSGFPLLDVRAHDWLVYSKDGDINILNTTDLRTRVKLPVTINTNEKEFDPTLVQTHEGELALFWTRGHDIYPTDFFYATSKDFLYWNTPVRIMFEEPAKHSSGRPVESVAGTNNIIPVPGGYMMLLRGGSARYSKDLRHWSAPKTIFEQSGWDNCLVKMKNGRIWAFYGDSPKGEEEENLCRKYKYLCHIIRASSSLDGKVWEQPQRIFISAEVRALWAFPLSDTQVAAGVQYSNFDVQWFVFSGPGAYQKIDSPVGSRFYNDVIGFFPRDNKVFCLQSAYDFTEESFVLLAKSSRELFRKLTR